MRKGVPAVLATMFVAAQAVTSSQSAMPPRVATDVTDADIRSVIAKAPPDGILDQLAEPVQGRLVSLRRASQGQENLMPFIIDAVKSYATLGEICDAMRDTFGTYEEVAIT